MTVMDKTVVAELSATLAALRSAGETGFWILAISLLIVIALVAIALVYQRMVIGRFQAASRATEETFKGVDAQLKTVDAQLKTIDTSLKERELGVKERDELRNIFSQQLSIFKETNTELRTEMSRIREQQKGLKESLNKTITAGLEDIRDRMTQISVKEIIAQVPETFRQDLEAEFSASLQAAITRINTQLQEKDVMNEYIEAVKEQISRELKDMLSAYTSDFDPRRFVPELIYRGVVEETGDRHLADRIARRIEERFHYPYPRWLR
jgi:hypothetical protein